MVDFAFYEGVYEGASIERADWPGCEKRAADQLARYKRIYAVTAPDKCAEAMAVCAMAEAFHSFDLLANGEGGAVTAAKIGSVSVSYGGAAGGADLSPKGQARELYRCARQYLGIYRGAAARC